MNLDSLIVDLYDDPRGEVLRRVCASPSDLPDFVKEASYAPEALEGLPDEAFAVVVLRDTEKLRKLAMHDPGNTALSALYLIEQAKYLPENFVKTAAENLCNACDAYGIAKPAQLEALRGGHEKTAEEAAPTSAVGRYVEDEPVKPEVKRTPLTHTLLGDKYPVETPEQVKLATTYFENYRDEMDPFFRQAYCTKLAQRMTELEMPIPESIEPYQYETRSYLAGSNIEGRKTLLSEDLHPVVDMLLEKSASIPDEALARGLEELDRATGIDRLWGKHLPDPVLSVYGPSWEKLASDGWSWSGNGYLIREEHLRELALNHSKAVKRQLGEEFQEKFLEDPKSAFESLPVTTKELVARMALENYT